MALINLVPVLVLLQIVITKNIFKQKFRNFVDGKRYHNKKGIVNFSMVEQRYTLDDLLLQLREKDVRSLDEVDYAIMKRTENYLFKKVIKSKHTPSIILDGKVEFENLYAIVKTKHGFTLIEKT
ncbi:MAG: YetF domain-containing protein [Intestinibacter sp.]